MGLFFCSVLSCSCFLCLKSLQPKCLHSGHVLLLLAVPSLCWQGTLLSFHRAGACERGSRESRFGTGDLTSLHMIFHAEHDGFGAQIENDAQRV